eukprot:5931992-Prymnesium_polylepis.2
MWRLGCPSLPTPPNPLIAPSFRRTSAMLARLGMPPYTHTNVEVLGSEHMFGPVRAQHLYTRHAGRSRCTPPSAPPSAVPTIPDACLLCAAASEPLGGRRA